MAVASRILIVGPAWVGDMVMAQALYKLLKQREPDCIIDVLAPAWSLPLLARMPEVRKGIEVPLGHGEFGLASRYRLGKQLRSEHYDRAIVIPRSLKAALIPFFAKAKQRSGYRGEMRFGLINDMRSLDKVILSKTVERYLALGMKSAESLPPATIPTPKLTTDRGNISQLLERLSLGSEGAVALLPGAEYGPAKQWPIEYWVELAQRLREVGHQVWILGSQKDHTNAQQIIQLAGEPEGMVNLCGRTELVDAVDLLSLCAIAVSNDSGLMHVAAAVDIPVVGIYGSSTPDYTPPLSKGAAVVYHNLDCSPCFKRQCPYGHYRCLREILPEQVYATISKQMQIKGNS
ncbi:MAG: lipopolysaccharide heptosyltransferase II [Pseudomonadota bacterium]